MWRKSVSSWKDLVDIEFPLYIPGIRISYLKQEDAP
jgi:hypothetical protein